MIGPRRHQYAAEAVRVPIQKLRCRVHHQVRAQFDWPLEIRGHEGVIHAQVHRLAHALRLFTAHGAHRADVGQLHQRVRRSFDVDQSGARRKCAAHALVITGIDVGELDAIVGDDLVEEPRRAAVDIGSADNVIARLQHGDQCRDRSHAAGEDMRGAAAFERGQVLLEGGAGRVRHA